MPDIRYDVTDSPTIARFLAARDASIEGLMGPFGSGKSTACVMKPVMLTHEMPPMRDGIKRARWGVIRNTYAQLEDTTIRTMHAWLPPAQWGTHKLSTHTYTVDGFKGVECEFLFRALDRPDHVQNLLSLELTGAWVNEAREVPREIIGPLFGRCGRWPPRAEVGEYQRYMMMDTNAPDTDSWWYGSFEDDKPEGWKLYRQPGGRSPQAENLRNLPPRYYEDMAAAMTDEEIKVYIDAEYGHIQSGKAVYPEYKDSWHCAEFEPIARVPILRCWDFGLTPAAVLLQVAPSGQVRVLDEVCAERAGITAFAPVVQAHCTAMYPWAKLERGLLRDIGDPAGDTPSQTDATTCYQIMRADGIDIQPGVQDVVLRHESVRHLLRTAVDGLPGLLVHPRCRMVRKGFQGEYKYRRLLVGGANARYATAPEKNRYSHPHDALQYGCVELVGDRVQGYARRPGERDQVAAISDFDPFKGVSDPPHYQHQQAYAESEFNPMRGAH